MAFTQNGDVWGRGQSPQPVCTWQYDLGPQVLSPQSTVHTEHVSNIKLDDSDLQTLLLCFWRREK